MQWQGQQLTETAAGARPPGPATPTAAAAARRGSPCCLPPQALYKPFVRLPAALLHDTSADGPLYLIASACGEHMRLKGLKRIDWLAPNLRKEVRWGGGGGVLAAAQRRMRWCRAGVHQALCRRL